MGLHAARAHRRSYTHSGLPTWLVKMYVPRAQHMCGYKLLWCVPKRCTWAHMTLMINATCWSSSAGVPKRNTAHSVVLNPHHVCASSQVENTQGGGGGARLVVAQRREPAHVALCAEACTGRMQHIRTSSDQKEGMMHPVIHTLPCILLDQYICSHQRSTLHPAGLIDPGDYGVARWEE